MVTNNTFQFPSSELSQLYIENFCLPVFILAAHVLQSQFPDGCPHTLGLCFDVDYHWASSLPPVTLSAPFDVSCVHFQIEFLIRSHYHFDFLLNDKSDLWHLAYIIWLEEELIEVAMIVERFGEIAGGLTWACLKGDILSRFIILFYPFLKL